MLWRGGGVELLWLVPSKGRLYVRTRVSIHCGKIEVRRLRSELYLKSGVSFSLASDISG